MNTSQGMIGIFMVNVSIVTKEHNTFAPYANTAIHVITRLRNRIRKSILTYSLLYSKLIWILSKHFVLNKHALALGIGA
jgi:hypothetical protein